MTDRLLWLEQSALPTGVRESDSLWSFPTMLTLHTLELGVLVGAVPSWTCASWDLPGRFRLRVCPR